MGMPATDFPVTTIEQLLALPEDGSRHELLDGEHVVTPAPMPPHQLVVVALMRALDRVLENHHHLALFTSPADVQLGPQTLVQPDLFVVETEPNTPLVRWADVGVPLIAIEILSPSTASRDRGKKRSIYQRAGVSQYWIVDTDARLVERWTPEDLRPEIIDRELPWSLPGGVSGTVVLDDIFHRLG